VEGPTVDLRMLSDTVEHRLNFNRPLIDQQLTANHWLTDPNFSQRFTVVTLANANDSLIRETMHYQKNPFKKERIKNTRRQQTKKQNQK